jgi:hypothetical protein
MSMLTIVLGASRDEPPGRTPLSQSMLEISTSGCSVLAALLT